MPQHRHQQPGRFASNQSPKPCAHYLRGTCKYGRNCKWSHYKPSGEPKDSQTAQQNQRRNTPDGTFQEWKALLHRHSGQGTTRINTSEVGRFFTLLLRLMEGDVGAAQEAVKQLANDSGLGFVRELTDRHTQTVQGKELYISLWNDQVKPFFELITHTRVVDSPVLEQHVATIFNFLYGVGGSRVARLSGFVVRLVESWPPAALENSRAEVIVLYLAVLSKIIECNTNAIVDKHFSDITARLTKLLGDNDGAQAGDDFYRRQARKYGDFIRRRIEVGDEIDQWESAPAAPVCRGDFVLNRDLPGRLSAQGQRHDNDHADISKIKILPTSEEITSMRGEYLPTTDPSQWHIQGIRGRLDREFRLLREDTVGQLRDTVRETLEMIRKPKEDRNRLGKNNVRTFTYSDVKPIDLDFDRFRGLGLVVRCQQPPSVKNMSDDARREWWRHCRRLQAGALVCLLDVRGMDLFCVVSESTMRTKDDKLPYQRGNNQQSAAVQPEAKMLTLSEDKDYLYVKLQLIDPGHHEVGQAMRWFRTIGSSPTKHLVEFPGVLLDSFKHTLQTLQRMYTIPDVPFSELLAPTDGIIGGLKVESAQYAKKPGFTFNLGCLTNDGTEFLVSSQNPPESEILESRSSLDSTQASALINTLCREFSLIQGPPGTGKSYTGEKIIKVLLASKKAAKLGPILCVCYTNHALDQLLEHLLDDGITGIIRMGSRSKSERLEQRNLRVIARTRDRTKYEGWELYNTGSEIDRIIEKEKALFEKLAQSGTTDAIKGFLEMNHPIHHRELFGTDDEGWTKVQKKFKNVIERWLLDGAEGTQCRHIDVLKQSKLSALNKIERYSIWKYWCKAVRDPIIREISRLHAEFVTAKNTQDRIRGERDIRCLQQADIVGITTTGLARNSELLRKLRCKVMVCEEAGEVLEAHILTALLPSVEHAILIGDHLQLRPQIQNFDLQSTNPRGEQYSLDMSLFERLVKPPGEGPTLPFDILETQRRMHPSIAELVRSTLYPNLKDAGAVASYPEVVGMKKRLFWLHHEQLEESAKSQDPVNTSHSNDFEIEMTTALVSHLVRQGTYAQGDIAVITPYLGQLHKLRRRMQSMFEICVNDRDLEDLEALEADSLEAAAVPKPPVSKSTLLKTVRVATVDNFQGEEAKVIIISLVRSNPQNKCGFLSTSNRINVLLSRAKHGMYIIGNSNTCLRVPMWNSVIQRLQKTDAFGTSLELQCPRHTETSVHVSQPDHFLQMSPEGGCNLACDKRLTCGHSCDKRCHSDVLHSAVKCLEKCVRALKGCDHSCPRVCGDPCPPRCQVVLRDTTVILPCGHPLSSPKCWEAQDVASLRCMVPVQRVVPGCNHQVKVHCFEDVAAATYRCQVECGHDRLCGHKCKSICHKCNTRQDGKLTEQNHGICSQICGRPYSTCRHTCTAVCHDGKSCQPCQAPCEVRCSHSKCSKPCNEPCTPCAERDCQSSCPHQSCSMPCAAPCDWVPCSKRCDKLISCGHQCPSLCGEPCPSEMYCQECGSEAIKTTCVDFLEMKEYREIDLDEDPCIFPSCGHFLTMSSMDGQMEMGAHYNIDENGHPISILKASEPFSLSDTDVKVCANCRGSLRNVSRYGRIVRRTLLDEATKKFITWANMRSAALTRTLISIEEYLEKATLDIPVKTTPKAKTFALPGSRLQVIQVLQELLSSPRYSKILKLRAEIVSFSRAVQEKEQPFQRVLDLVNHANRHHHRKTNQKFLVDESVVQVKGHLLAAVLLMKCDIVVLTDFVRRYKENPLFFIGKLSRVDWRFSAHFVDCKQMMELAQATKHPREQVHSHIFSAQLYWFQSFFAPLAGQNLPSEGGAIGDPVEQKRAQLESARKHIAEARLLIKEYPSTAILAPEADFVDGLLEDDKSGVSAEEMRSIYNAMAQEFSGTGHWYRCEQGHAFTIGECGMPMERARCPDCGSPIGGQNHRAEPGVNSADDIEELGRGFAGLGV